MKTPKPKLNISKVIALDSPNPLSYIRYFLTLCVFGVKTQIKKPHTAIVKKFDKNPKKYLSITIIKIYAISQIFQIDYYQNLTNNINKTSPYIKKLICNALA